MTVQIVEIAGQKMAMLPVAEYERLIDIAEDKADAIAAAEAERRRLEGEEYLPAEMVDRILAGESPPKVWRKHRGLTLDQLARAAKMGHTILSRIENGKLQGRTAAWKRLAEALRVSADDILPDA
ncbi:MAG TPA: helix-turn-helix transcriptional regulator [Allosphingosinicella sp.]